MSSPSPQTTVFFQDKCLGHRYMRSGDVSTIFERPQRLRAVKTGVAVAVARLEQRRQEEIKASSGASEGLSSSGDALVDALQQLNISQDQRDQGAIKVIISTASVDILNHPAVKYIHGDINGDLYLEKLVTLCRESEEKIARGESEIPEGLSQTDLYLCSKSLEAIEGSIGTVCEAVDLVMQATSTRVDATPSGEPSRAFVAIRPPGHHCGEDTPSGFCFVNNVAIGAAHAHLKHGISRAVVLDIDLHHGNGTQSLAWQINEEGYRQQLEVEASGVPDKPPFQVYYGSIHDPLSYPCEDGNLALIQAASVSIHGPHGQHIENVHLLPYESEAHFWEQLYNGPYTRLLKKAEDFLKGGTGEAVIFISAGFDASEHETASMSRHGRKLPTGFYKKFARDVRTLADTYAKGRIVSVLEGGYSDRALHSGAMAHVLGLAEEDIEVDEDWWSIENLIKIEKATKSRRGGRSSTTTAEKWIERTISLLSSYDPNYEPPAPSKPIPPSTMTLRDRSKKSFNASEAVTTPTPSQSLASARKDGQKSASGVLVKDNIEVSDAELAPDVQAKKLPRVLLRVNPPNLHSNEDI